MVYPHKYNFRKDMRIMATFSLTERDELSNFGKLHKERRAALNLSLQQAAELLGCSRALLGFIEGNGFMGRTDALGYSPRKAALHAIKLEIPFDEIPTVFTKRSDWKEIVHRVREELGLAEVEIVLPNQGTGPPIEPDLAGIVPDPTPKVASRRLTKEEFKVRIQTRVDELGVTAKELADILGLANEQTVKTNVLYLSGRFSRSLIEDACTCLGIPFEEIPEEIAVLETRRRLNKPPVKPIVAGMGKQKRSEAEHPSQPSIKKASGNISDLAITLPGSKEAPPLVVHPAPAPAAVQPPSPSKSVQVPKVSRPATPATDYEVLKLLENHPAELKRFEEIRSENVALRMRVTAAPTNAQGHSNGEVNERNLLHVLELAEKLGSQLVGRVIGIAGTKAATDKGIKNIGAETDFAYTGIEEYRSICAELLDWTTLVVRANYGSASDRENAIAKLAKMIISVANRG